MVYVLRNINRICKARPSCAQQKEGRQEYPGGEQPYTALALILKSILEYEKKSGYREYCRDCWPSPREREIRKRDVYEVFDAHAVEFPPKWGFSYAEVSIVHRVCSALGRRDVRSFRRKGNC